MFWAASKKTQDQVQAFSIGKTEKKPVWLKQSERVGESIVGYGRIKLRAQARES